MMCTALYRLTSKSTSRRISGFQNQGKKILQHLDSSKNQRHKNDLHYQKCLLQMFLSITHNCNTDTANTNDQEILKTLKDHGALLEMDIFNVYISK